MGTLIVSLDWTQCINALQIYRTKFSQCLSITHNSVHALHSTPFLNADKHYTLRSLFSLKNHIVFCKMTMFKTPNLHNFVVFSFSCFPHVLMELTCLLFEFVFFFPLINLVRLCFWFRKYKLCSLWYHVVDCVLPRDSYCTKMWILK